MHRRSNTLVLKLSHSVAIEPRQDIATRLWLQSRLDLQTDLLWLTLARNGLDESELLQHIIWTDRPACRL